MIFVVDTSVAIKWFVGEQDTARAEALLSPDLELAAPDFLIAEVGNVLWRKQRRNDIDGEQVEKALQQLPSFFQNLSPSAELILDALHIARDIQHSIYDCIFLAYTKQLSDAVLVTADDRLVTKLQASPYETLVKPLSDISPIVEP